MSLFLKRIRHKLKVGLVAIGYYSRPQFLIIGAQKSGTSSIHKALSLHPKIIPAITKEIHFFDQEFLYNKGVNWYHTQFLLPYHMKRDAMTFEATPLYIYPSQCAQRIFTYNSKIKLIAILRNPLERAYSAWNMYRYFYHHAPQILLEASKDSTQPQWVDEMLSRKSFPDFTQAVQSEIEAIVTENLSLLPGYVRRGLYYEQLQRYFALFERDQLLILDFNCVKANMTHVLKEITRFLNLSEYDWSKNELPHISARYHEYQEKMDDKTRSLLKEFYLPYNQKLYSLLGRDFDWI